MHKQQPGCAELLQQSVNIWTSYAEIKIEFLMKLSTCICCSCAYILTEIRIVHGNLGSHIFKMISIFL